MRVLLVITDEDWYESAGYAAAWVRALEEQGAEVERLARVPADWPVTGPPPGVSNPADDPARLPGPRRPGM